MRHKVSNVNHGTINEYVQWQCDSLERSTNIIQPARVAREVARAAVMLTKVSIREVFSARPGVTLLTLKDRKACEQISVGIANLLKLTPPREMVRDKRANGDHNVCQCPPRLQSSLQTPRQKRYCTDQVQARVQEALVDLYGSKCLPQVHRKTTSRMSSQSNHEF